MQALWALISNSYLQGFLSGKIYGGRLKELCVVLQSRKQRLP